MGKSIPSTIYIYFFMREFFSIVSAQVPFTVTTTCPSTTRFDISSLECVACGSNQMAKSSGRECQCTSGFARVFEDDFTAQNHIFSCRSCLVMNLAPSRDGSKCMGCDSLSGATLDSTNALDCICPSGFVLRETNAAGSPLTNKTCVECPSNTVVLSNDAYNCKGCPHPSMSIDGAGICSCGPGYAASGGTCILQSQQSYIVSNFPLGTAAQVEYQDVASISTGESAKSVTVQSTAFELAYLVVATQCNFARNREACQQLANLCSLQKNSRDAIVCKLLVTIGTSITDQVHGFNAWKVGLPLESFADSSILKSTVLSAEVSLNEQISADVVGAKISTLTYFLASYAFNGTFLGLQLLTNQLQLCGGEPNRTSHFARFGALYENKCKIDLKTFLNARGEPVFYDLFYVDEDNELFPVPLAISVAHPTIDSGVSPHIAINSAKKLYRRFYLWDTISGVQTRGEYPKVLSYAKTITLHVALHNGLSKDIISPPALYIEYANVDVSSIITTTGDNSLNVPVSFRSEYSRNLDTFNTALIVLFVVGLVFAISTWIGDMIKLSRHSTSSQIFDASFLHSSIFSFIGISAEIMFWLLFITTGYCLVFFKGQGVPFFLLPLKGSSEEKIFKTSLIYAFVCKMLALLRHIWRQVNMDIFFIDWERPRHLNQQNANPQKTVNENGDDHESSRAPVSVWRKLFAANEWNELQVEGTIHVEFVLFLILFFLRGLNLEYIATSQPTFNNLDGDAAPINIILRFAVTTSIWLCLWFLQNIYRQLIHHRFFENKAAQFIDFVTMCNISVIILDDAYHGYYIHGKTLHAFADASLEEMNQQLEMEARQLVRRRGLIDGKDTFELYVTPEFRLHYSLVYNDLAKRQQFQKHHLCARRNQLEQHQQHQRQGGQIQRDTLIAVPVGLIEANAKLNRFLHNFIDRNSSSAYPWTEVQRTYLERVFDIPPDVKQRKTSLFLDDPQYKWTSVLLMGIEYHMITFLALLYAITDLIFDNTFVSILVSYVSYGAIRLFRKHWGQINLSRKTLVDDRFLI